MELSIPDFRTFSHQLPDQPSPELFGTVFQMQRRQDFLREQTQNMGEEPVGFVGSANFFDEPVIVAEDMRRVLKLNDGRADKVPNWQAVVASSGRRLSPQESSQ